VADEAASVPWSEVRTSLQQDITVRARVIIGAIVTAPDIDALVALVTGAREADACGLRGWRRASPTQSAEELAEPVTRENDIRFGHDPASPMPRGFARPACH
jgi:hypothetical protein